MTDDRIQKGLEHDARITKQRVPENMTGDEIKAVAASLRAFMNEHGLSQGKVAALLGVDRSMVGAFVGRRGYRGNVQKLAKKIVNLINSVDRKCRQARHGAYVETAVAKKIFTLVTQTEAFSISEGKVGIIIGDGGHGKSVCLRQFAEANKNTMYIELDATMSSTAIFGEIAKRLKLNSSGTVAAICKRVVGGLKCRNVIVILDEASSLEVKQLNQLRQIVVVKGRCPLILAGNGDLLKTVIQRSSKCGYESLDQLTSRVMAVLNLDELASDRDGGLYTAEEIRKLYEFGGLRLTTDAVGTLRRICKTPKSGRLRTCSHIITALHTSGAVREKGYIDGKTIVAAINQLHLPVMVRLPFTGDTMTESEAGQAIAAAG